MNLSKLVKDNVNNRPKKERVIGRYWATDLYGILTGDITPDNFFKEKKFDARSAKNIRTGEIWEKALKEELDAGKIPHEYQVKKLFKFKNFELVAVADFVFPNSVLEIKSPTIMEPAIKKYHYPQLETQYRIFKKDIHIGYIKDRFEASFFKYKPDDSLWDLIKVALEDFHNKLSKKGYRL